MTVIELEKRFGIADTLRFEEGPGGLARAVVASPLAAGTVYLHGAHVTSWTPRGERPVLFTSARSRFQAGVPIRGGVPIAFPWFGPRVDSAAGPLHGFARIIEWEMESTAVRADGAVEVVMTLGPNEVSREFGFDAFALRFRVAMGTSLEMELEVRNMADSEWRFEEALHTYFAVSEIHAVSISGLEGTTYIDKTDALARKVVEGPIRIGKETDQVHVNTSSTCRITDEAWGRTVVVEKSGSNATVVWNPWIEKNRSLSDMDPEDWHEMVCVETVNALEDAVVLPGGGVHRMGTTVRVEAGV